MPCLLVRLDSKDVAMFRFLLEAHENLAVFTVLERKPALIKLLFTDESQREVRKVLDAIGQTVPLKLLPWPFMDDYGND